MQYRHKIPLHLEVEDHIMAGLTARQLLLIGAGLAVGYLIWSNLSALTRSSAGLVLASLLCLLPVMAGLAVAFFRSGSRGLEEWAVVGLIYLAQPKHYLWSELPEDTSDVPDEQQVRSEPLTEEEE